MHKSPDRFEIELEREIALEQARDAPSDPELAADWALRRELKGLGRAELPLRARKRVLRAATVGQHTPWFMAAAAALVAAVVVTLVLQAPPQSARVVEPSAHDMAELQVAFETLDATGRRAVALAGREVSESLEVPDLGLAELPYANYVRPYFKRPDQS